MILIDSDVAIDILREHLPAIAWFDQITVDDQIVLPGFVALELIAGTSNAAEMRQMLGWLEEFVLFWPEHPAYQRALSDFAAVHLRNAIDVVDVLIAQVALTWHIPLHTFNTKHYAAIPNLQTIQPYAR